MKRQKKVKEMDLSAEIDKISFLLDKRYNDYWFEKITANRDQIQKKENADDCITKNY